jgi:predicted CXXCH cytochrome family protein
MKKVSLILAVAGILAASSALAATIVGSKHDLSPTGGTSLVDGTSTQICIYCHTPHGAALSLPLWNRTNPGGAGFTLYSGVGMQNVSYKTGFTSDSTSLFCMSCHDGATAVNAIHNTGVIEGNHPANNTGIFAVGTISGNANLTTNLSTTHPINFPVSATQGETNGQRDLWVGSGASMGKAGYEMPLFKAASRGTPNRSLECGSCHAVHDSANSPFLRYTMAGSALCLGCHNK